MKDSVIYDPVYFSEKPVDSATAKLALSFLSGVSSRLEDPSEISLITQIVKLQWVKTGDEIKKNNHIFLDIDLSKIQEEQLVAVLCRSFYHLSKDYFAKDTEKGVRYDDVFLLDAKTLGKASRSDSPLDWVLGHEDIGSVEGNFIEIDLPEEGYHIYIQDFLSQLDYTSYDYIDKDYYKQTHPIIREYIDSQFSLYLEKE